MQSKKKYSLELTRIGTATKLSRLQKSINENFVEIASGSCETALNFFLNHIKPKWNFYKKTIQHEIETYRLN